MLKDKMKVKQLRMFAKMVSGKCEGNKQDLINTIIKYQQDHLQILLETNEGYVLNPNLSELSLWEYSSYHHAMHM
jgi:hypothetical protein